MALEAQVLLSILAHESSSGDLSDTLRVTPATYAMALADGTGADQAEVVWSDSRTISAASSETLDLTTLPDERGIVSVEKVRLIYVKNTHETEELRLGGSTLGAFGGLPATVYRTLPPGGAYLMTSPTTDGISGGASAQFASASGEVTYDIILIGEGSIS